MLGLRGSMINLLDGMFYTFSLSKCVCVDYS